MHALNCSGATDLTRCSCLPHLPPHVNQHCVPLPVSSLQKGTTFSHPETPVANPQIAVSSLPPARARGPKRSSLRPRWTLRYLLLLEPFGARPKPPVDGHARWRGHLPMSPSPLQPVPVQHLAMQPSSSASSGGHGNGWGTSISSDMTCRSLCGQKHP